MPLFAKHSESVQWDELRNIVGKVLLATFALTALVGAILTPLASPIVSLIFERQVRCVDLGVQNML